MGSTGIHPAIALIDNQGAFLQRYYHQLTRCIRPQTFYSYLRTRNILTLDDQEIIENTFITTYLKAGCLIDIITRKGERGFVAFMEVVEYAYPDLFRDITGHQARPPPKEFCPPGMIRSLKKQPSAEILQLMSQVTNTLLQEVAEKKCQLMEVQNLVDRMKEERIAEEDVTNSLYNELALTKDKVEQLRSDNADLVRQLSNMKGEKDQERRRYQETLSQKDTYMEQCNQLRVHCQKMGSKVEELHALKRNNSCRTTHEQQEKLKLENKELECQPQVKKMDIPNNGPIITELKLKCANLEKRLEELALENADVTGKSKDLEGRCLLLQENNSQWQTTLEQCLAERDQIRKLFNEMEMRYNEEVTKNGNMTQECRQYMERYREMAEMLENLNRELEEQRTNQCSRNSWYYQRERLKNLDTTKYKKWNTMNKTTENKPENSLSRTGDKFKHETFSDKENKSYKRNASFPIIGAEPLVVFMPKEIEQQVFQLLKTNFDSCPISIIQSEEEMTNSIHNLDVLHYEDRMPDGYHCIMTSSLQQVKSTVLMSLPVNCIHRMYRASIRPLVAVIKFENNQGCYELSNEEEVLERNEVDYELILVDEKLKTDLPKLAEYVLPKLKHLPKT